MFAWLRKSLYICEPDIKDSLKLLLVKSFFFCRLNDLHYKYVAQYFTRGQLKSRDEKIFETFHRINRRDAEELVTEIEKG